MQANSFFHRHYLVDGESLTTHAGAVLTGGVLMLVGIALGTTVALLPVAVAVGFLGFLIFSGGILAHVQSPVKPRELVDSVISLAGAAIAMTFALAAVLFVLAFSVSVAAVLIGCLRTVW
jgi:hypothetical protein